MLLQQLMSIIVKTGTPVKYMAMAAPPLNRVYTHYVGRKPSSDFLIIVLAAQSFKRMVLLVICTSFLLIERNELTVVLSVAVGSYGLSDYGSPLMDRA